MLAKVKSGVCYYQKHASAVEAIGMVRHEFPEVRIVRYELGYALQVTKSGDYLGPDLRPSMETKLNAFFA
jgi:hypothetical protein